MASKYTDCLSESYHSKGSNTTYTNNNGTRHARTNHKRLKPYRPCPFCMKMQSKLRYHIEKKHKYEEDVEHALQLPKQERNKAFANMKKRGIILKNIELQSKNKENSLLRERSRGNEDELIYCSKCLAHISRLYFCRHKTICCIAEHSINTPLTITTGLQRDRKKIITFEEDFLKTFQKDEVGNMCITDELILDYGRHVFKKSQSKNYKKDIKRKHLKMDMRRLSNLIITTKQICNKENLTFLSSVDLFNKKYFEIIQVAITKLTTHVDGTIKHESKAAIFYLIKKVAKYIYGEHLYNKSDKKAAEINKFLNVVNSYDFEYIVATNDKDVKKLRDYIAYQIQICVHDVYRFITKTEYCLLRDAVLSSLTLLNAHREGDPSRLILSELDNTFNDVDMKIHDPVEQYLTKRVKVAYQPGRHQKMLPLLIIDDCLEALHLLTNPEIRAQAGIHPKNPYVFPTIQHFNKHELGWCCVKRCCTLANIKITKVTTSKRHTLATLYMGLNVANDKRPLFYQRMISNILSQ